jgi:tryptophanyl-tRNA synthetase
MSKSYDNTVALFAPREALKKQIQSIVTDSRAPGERKDTEGSALFQIYQAFASADETAAMRAAFADGIGWGDAKQRLFERIDDEVAPLREQYEALIAQPQRIEQQLRDGAQRLRAQYATPTLARLRDAVGLRDLSAKASSPAKRRSPSKVILKQYRERDSFYFKVIDENQNLVAQSLPFDSPKDVGKAISCLKQKLDVILLDVAMPSLNKLRLQVGPETPVVVIEVGGVPSPVATVPVGVGADKAKSVLSSLFTDDKSH